MLDQQGLSEVVAFLRKELQLADAESYRQGLATAQVPAVDSLQKFHDLRLDPNPSKQLV
eukprot:COSAG06_NODE_55486_length_289_cov_0.852632_1_plen_58_part_01